VGFAEVTGDPGDALLADPAPQPDEAHERRDREGKLTAALGRLGATDRLAILLHDQEGMSAAEVARAIGGTAGAARIRLFRARRKLRLWLRELS
jgi:RNA polymerase sigma-70 factor (ECF subfamily)